MGTTKMDPTITSLQLTKVTTEQPMARITPSQNLEVRGLKKVKTLAGEQIRVETITRTMKTAGTGTTITTAVLLTDITTTKAPNSRGMKVEIITEMEEVGRGSKCISGIAIF